MFKKKIGMQIEKTVIDKTKFRWNIIYRYTHEPFIPFFIFFCHLIPRYPTLERERYRFTPSNNNGGYLHNCTTLPSPLHKKV